MVQQMFADFFLFKLVKNIGLEAKGAEGALQWAPAPLTSHDLLYLVDYMSCAEKEIVIIFGGGDLFTCSQNEHLCIHCFCQHLLCVQKKQCFLLLGLRKNKSKLWPREGCSNLT